MRSGRLLGTISPNARPVWWKKRMLPHVRSYASIDGASAVFITRSAGLFFFSPAINRLSGASSGTTSSRKSMLVVSDYQSSPETGLDPTARNKTVRIYGFMSPRHLVLRILFGFLPRLTDKCSPDYGVSSDLDANASPELEGPEFSFKLGMYPSPSKNQGEIEVPG